MILVLNPKQNIFSVYQFCSRRFMQKMKIKRRQNQKFRDKKIQELLKTSMGVAQFFQTLAFNQQYNLSKANTVKRQYTQKSSISTVAEIPGEESQPMKTGQKPIYGPLSYLFIKKIQKKQKKNYFQSNYELFQLKLFEEDTFSKNYNRKLRIIDDLSLFINRVSYLSYFSRQINNPLELRVYIFQIRYLEGSQCSVIFKISLKKVKLNIKVKIEKLALKTHEEKMIQMIRLIAKIKEIFYEQHVFYCRYGRPLIIIFLQKMFDLGRQSYLIPLQHKQIKTKTFNELGLQNAKHLSEEKRWNRQKKNKKKQSVKHGKWTLRQKMRYLLFLEKNIDLFVDTQSRKKFKIFSKMSKYIKSRITSQCKSHHQKALRIHKSQNNIISSLRRNFRPLKAEWNQFFRTEQRVLLNAYPEINKNQSFYKIYQYSDVIKIEINTNHMESYY